MENGAKELPEDGNHFHALINLRSPIQVEAIGQQVGQLAEEAEKEKSGPLQRKVGELLVLFVQLELGIGEVGLLGGIGE